MDVENAGKLKIASADIDFVDVDYQHIDDQRNNKLFKKLNLHVSAGEKIGLVGPSGGGKTTLTRLLLRLPTSKTVK